MDEDDSALSWFSLAMFLIMVAATTGNLYMINQVSNSLQEMRVQVNKLTYQKMRNL